MAPTERRREAVCEGDREGVAGGGVMTAGGEGGWGLEGEGDEGDHDGGGEAEHQLQLPPAGGVGGGEGGGDPSKQYAKNGPSRHEDAGEEPMVPGDGPFERVQEGDGPLCAAGHAEQRPAHRVHPEARCDRAGEGQDARAGCAAEQDGLAADVVGERGQQQGAGAPCGEEGRRDGRQLQHRLVRRAAQKIDCDAAVGEHGLQDE
mmetsp:Transcript_817/g.2509  ORF Transcript_817/g.2509 Transcript_817/m.2509 type:complete len:204 (+) Transcript_817:157-768(+)